MAEFPENHFDVVYARDAIMHIAKKQELYEKVFVSNKIDIIPIQTIKIQISCLSCSSKINSFFTEMDETKWPTSGVRICAWKYIS